jgi:hypothetical protein
MYHLIEVTIAFTADLEASPRHRLERLRVRTGLPLAHVVQRGGELYDVADLFFEDGTTTRQVPLERLFEQAARDRSKAFGLTHELDRVGVFKEYEDRFLDLFKKAS